MPLLVQRRVVMSDSRLLGPFVRRFLLEEVIANRSLSINTQKSYRDSIHLLFSFIKDFQGTDPGHPRTDHCGSPTCLPRPFGKGTWQLDSHAKPAPWGAPFFVQIYWPTGARNSGTGKPYPGPTTPSRFYSDYGLHRQARDRCPSRCAKPEAPTRPP